MTKSSKFKRWIEESKLQRSKPKTKKVTLQRIRFLVPEMKGNLAFLRS